MLCLSDDCLCTIFDYLCIKDQLNCAKSHERFNLLLREIVWKKKSFPSRAFDELKGTVAYDEIFSMHTEQMKALTIGVDKLPGSTEWFHTRIGFSSQFYYPNLQYINLHAVGLLVSLDDFQLQSHQCPDLTSLHIVASTAVLHFGKPSVGKIPYPLERGMLCHNSCNGEPLMRAALRLQNNLDLNLKILKISVHSIDNEFLRLLRESVLKSLKVLVICLDWSYCNSLGLFLSIAELVMELGVFHARLLWNGATNSFPNVLKLHLSGITTSFWLLLGSCPKVENISFFYEIGTENTQRERAVYIDDILYGRSCTLERQPNEKVIAMRFHTTMRSCLEQMIKEKGPQTVIWERRYYRFEYFFEESIDERYYRFPPCLQFYF